MLLTRSIRRKLVILLTLVVVMLTGMAFISLTGLAGYKRVVKDLDVTIRQAPRASDLLASLMRLNEPFSAQPPPDNVTEAERRAVRRQQRAHLEDALADVSAEVDDYFARISRLPTDRVAAQSAHSIHNQMRERLANLMAAAPRIETDRRDQTVVRIAREIATLTSLAEQVPPPSDALFTKLRAAEEDYRLHVRGVRWTGLTVALLLLLLGERLYRWVVRPIQRLACGARKVAAGDYETRIRNVDGGDEMTELAETFNRMTERFARVLAERDTEIDTRSRQLVQSARLADVGFLAAGIAHEVNNPLSAIGMASESLEWRLGELLEQAKAGGADEADLDGIRQYLQMIQTESGRVRDLTQRMLDFARRSPESDATDRNLYDLTAIVSEVLEMVSHLKRYGQRAIVWHPSAPIRARVNASQVKQVVLNLVTNALEAMEDGGTLRIGIARHCEEVELTFADDGCGMAPETAEHIFDPFFTTKGGGSSGLAGSGGGESLADGRAAHTGTGLGLAISHRIVEDHGGSLEASSDGPGQGSTFRLLLPEAESASRLAA